MALPGAFLEIFSWFQKATLGTRLALNAPGALGCPSTFPARLVAQQQVLWPPAGRFV